MKNLFNRIKNSVINVKQAWNKKAYQRKEITGFLLLFSQLGLSFALIFCILLLNAPLLQSMLSFGLIALSLFNLRITFKSIKEREKEADEKLVELKKRDTEKMMALDKEVKKHSYDKDTQEALQSLFSENKNSDDVALMEVEKDDKNVVQTFSNTFNK